MRASLFHATFVVANLCVAVCLYAQPAASETKSSEQKAPAAAASNAAPAETRPAADPPTAAADPSGSWKWDFESPDGQKLAFVLKLKSDGKKITGKYTAFENTVDVQDAKVDKDTLTFAVRQDLGGFQSEVKFNGKVAKDEIKGKIQVAFGDQPQEFDWTAKRFLEPEDVVGVWELETAGFDGNPFRSTLTITKDDKGLHAKTASDFGDLEASKVEIKDNQLLYELAPPAQGDFAFKIGNKATPRGNTIEGSTSFDFNGQANEMKFTGKRQPPKEEAKSADARPATDAKAGGETKSAAQGGPAASGAAKSDAK
jgi:hypothetical protein